MPDHKITFAKLAAGSGYVPAAKTFEGELTGDLVRKKDEAFLVGSKGARIRLDLPEKTENVSGRVCVTGLLSKDPANISHPYKMRVTRLRAIVND